MAVDGSTIIMAIITFASVIVAIVSIIISNRQYKNSLAPVITFGLTYNKMENLLNLSICNKGLTEITDAKIVVHEIRRNNSNIYDDGYDELSNKIFDLYPGEVISNHVGSFATSCSNPYMPDWVQLSFEYTVDKKNIKITRRVGFNVE